MAKQPHKTRMSKELRRAVEACDQLNGGDVGTLINMPCNVGHWGGDFTKLLADWGLPRPARHGEGRASR